MAISTPRLLRRRDKLLALIERFGSAKLADDIGTPRSHMSAMSKGVRGIGDLLAEKLDHYAAEHFGKEAGWIDRDEEPGVEQTMPFRDLDPFEVQLITLFRRLPGDDDRQHALIEMNNRLNAASAPVQSAANPWAGKERRYRDFGHVPERREGVNYTEGKEPHPRPLGRVVRR